MFQGADTAGLGDWAERAHARALATGDLVSGVLAAAREVSWTGPDGNEFRARAEVLIARVDDLMERVRDAAVEAIDHADEQDATSESDGSATAWALRPNAPSISTAAPPAVAPAATAPRPVPSPETAPAEPEPAAPVRVTIDEAVAAADWARAHPEGPTWEAALAEYRVGDAMRPDALPDAVEAAARLDVGTAAGEDTATDRDRWATYGALVRGLRIARPELATALDLHEHFRGGSGEPFTVDLEAAGREDHAIARSIVQGVAEAQIAVCRRIEEGGIGDGAVFAFTGPVRHSGAEPESVVWDSALGGHARWADGEVVVEDGRSRMTVTVHAERLYDRDAVPPPLSSSRPADLHGRFAALGWERPFVVTGETTRLVTWALDSPETATIAHIPPGAS